MATVEVRKMNKEQMRNEEIISLECEQTIERSFYDRSTWSRTESVTKTRMGLIVEQWNKRGDRTVTFYIH